MISVNIERLFGLACSGDIETLEMYYNNGENLNVTYNKFGKEHSLIMGAYRNRQYDTVKWLKNHGCSLSEDEQDEINMEYLRIKTIELLASDTVKMY